MLAALVLTSFVIAIPACSTPRMELYEGARPAQIQGDWDDVIASAKLAAGRSEMAVMGVSEPSESVIVIRLRTTLDRDGELRVERDEGGRLTADAAIGRFGDERAERRILAAFARRMEQLHRVEVAPAD